MESFLGKLFSAGQIPGITQPKYSTLSNNHETCSVKYREKLDFMTPVLWTDKFLSRTSSYLPSRFLASILSRKTKVEKGRASAGNQGQ